MSVKFIYLYVFFSGKTQWYRKLFPNICKILLGRKKYYLILFESIILQLFETIKKSSRTPVVTEINKIQTKTKYWKCLAKTTKIATGNKRNNLHAYFAKHDMNESAGFTKHAKLRKFI